MLNALRLFENVGQFESANGSRLPLAKLTLLYAENGRGKTTLAAILRSLVTGEAVSILERKRLTSANPPHVIVECAGGTSPAIFNNGAWTRTFPNMAIFDDQFVHDNVCSGLSIGTDQKQNLHELILGAQGVTLNDALQRCVEQAETHIRAVRDKGNAIPAMIRGTLTVDEFCALPVHADIDTAIQDAERALAATREQGKIAAGKNFDLVSMPELDISPIVALLGRNLPDVQAEATQQVQAHIAALGERGEAWVDYGMHKVEQQTGDKSCPFCEQSLSSSPIIAHYEAYFSEAYKRLKNDVADAATAFRQKYSGAKATEFERGVSNAAENARFWGQFAAMPNINLASSAIADIWNTMFQTIDAALTQKEHSPLDPITLPASALQAVQKYSQTRASVVLLNDELTAANMQIRVVKEQAAAGDVRALEADLVKLKATKARHSAAIDPLCRDYLAEVAAKALAETQKAAARTALDQYRTNVFPAYQAAINEYLRKFNAGFRIDSVQSQNTRAGSSCTYSVVVNNTAVPVTAANTQAGQPSFRTTLSAGDRNTLALAFFFASLDQDPSLAGKVVVIDDPVSSLDDHRSLVTVQEIGHLLDRVGQVVVLSHSKPFLCTVWDNTTRTQKAALQFSRQASSSAIQHWDVTADMITPHDRNHELLRGYVDAATPNNRPVAAAIRPVLEAFIRVAYPESFPAGSLLGPFLNVCNQRLGTPRQILDQADITELTALVDYGNLFHHDTNPSWQSQHINDAELLGFVNRALAFAKR